MTAISTRTRAARAAVKATASAMSFDERLKRARELVSEGRRLLHSANRNLNVGTVLVRRTHQRLTDTEAYFRRNPNPLTIASR